MNTNKLDDFSTYYKGPVGKNSPFIPKNIKEYPLLPVEGIDNDSDSLVENIFPMKEIDLKLFYLIQEHKKSHESKTSEVKTNLPDLKQQYNAFYYSTLLSYQKEFEQKYNVMSKLHKTSEIYKFEMTKLYVDKYNMQKEVILPKIEDISFKHKNEAEVKEEKEIEKENLLRQQEDEDAVQKSITQSSRNNVIVDESKLEELMAKLDPLNKYRQVAVNTIPEMTYNPMNLFMEKNYQDINNVVMNKTKWAELTTKDNKNRLHAFSEEEEKLFYEGFMLYPKEFGKICKYMKYKRTVAELISYYYHTKLQKNYFGKYLKMKEDLEKEKEMKKQKKKIQKQQVKPSSTALPNETTPSSPTFSGKKKIDRSANNTPKQPSKKAVIAVAESSLKNTEPEGGHVKFDLPDDVLRVEKIEDVKTEKIEDQQLIDQKSIPVVAGIEKRSDSNAQEGSKIQQDGSQALSTAESVPILSDNEQQKFGKKRKLSSEASFGSDTPLSRKTSTSKTSYWSVHEAAVFPDLLKKHGKDWKSISADIGTKSVTMIRNYYMKKGKELGFDSYVEEFVQRQKALGIEVVQDDDLANNSRSVSPIEPQQLQTDADVEKKHLPVKDTITSQAIVDEPNQKQIHVLPPLSQQLLNKRAPYAMPLQPQISQHYPQPIKPSLELFPQQQQKQLLQNGQLQPIQPKIGHQLPSLALRKGTSVGGLALSSFDLPQQTAVNLPPIASYNPQGTPKIHSFPLPHLSNTAMNKGPPVNTYNNNVPITPNYLQNSSAALNKLQYSLSNKNISNHKNLATLTQSYSSFLPKTATIPAGERMLPGRNTLPLLTINKNKMQPADSNLSLAATTISSSTSFFDPLSALAAIASNEQKLLDKEEEEEKKKNSQ